MTKLIRESPLWVHNLEHLAFRLNRYGFPNRGICDSSLWLGGHIAFAPISVTKGDFAGS
jgi:hypothetical protein